MQMKEYRASLFNIAALVATNVPMSVDTYAFVHVLTLVATCMVTEVAMQVGMTIRKSLS